MSCASLFPTCIIPTSQAFLILHLQNSKWTPRCGNIKTQIQHCPAGAHLSPASLSCQSLLLDTAGPCDLSYTCQEPRPVNSEHSAPMNIFMQVWSSSSSAVLECLLSCSLLGTPLPPFPRQLYEIKGYGKPGFCDS